MKDRTGSSEHTSFLATSPANEKPDLNREPESRLFKAAQNRENKAVDEKGAGLRALGMVGAKENSEKKIKGRNARAEQSPGKRKPKRVFVSSTSTAATSGSKEQQQHAESPFERYHQTTSSFGEIGPKGGIVYGR